MAHTTSGAKAVTPTVNPHAAGDSAAPGSGRGTKSDSKRTSVTGQSTRNAARAWTPEQAREILSQTAIECQHAGLALRIYNSTRGTVVVELLAHQIVDGVIVPTAESARANHQKPESSEGAL